jgi:hypothetical protein
VRAADISLALLILSLFSGFSGAAETQEYVTRGETVQNRSRPELDPIGVNLGSFVLFPRLNLQESYNDNIFYSEADRTPDFITTLSPSLDLGSNWNTNSLNLHADLAPAFYADHTGQNYMTYNLFGNGTLDFTRKLQLFGNVGYSLLHENPHSLENPNAIRPTQYHLFTGTVGGRTQLDRMSLEQKTEFDHYTYESNPAVGGGTIVNSQRNYKQTETSLKIGYEVIPQRTVFLRGAYNWVRYDVVPVHGFDRNSNGYTVEIGANYDLTGILFVELFAGYLSQSYDDPAFPAISGPTGGATLIWNVTRLTTITGSLSRKLGQTTTPGAAGYISIDGDLRVDHELLRDLLLHAEIGYSNNKYNGISRNDTWYKAGFGAEYRPNRRISLSCGYSYLKSDSSFVGGSYGQNIILVQLTGHL